MQCQKSRDLIRAHSLGLPLSGREAEWRKHVAECENCRRLWAESQRAVEDLRGAFAYPAPAFLEARVLSRAAALAARPAPAPRAPLVLNWLSASIVLATAVLSIRLLAQPTLPLVDCYVLEGRTLAEVVQNNPDRMQFLTQWNTEDK